MKQFASLLLLAALAQAAGPVRLRPPLWKDADQRPIPKPKTQDVSELYALTYNSWFRHLSIERALLAARDRGALNVNAWGEVPDSSWFTNRIGLRSIRFEELLASLPGEPPSPGVFEVERNLQEGYTPKFRIRDSTGRRYWIKFDIPDAPERNSGAECISTLVLHAAGYNVPRNSVVWLRPADLRLAEKARFEDALGKTRPMTAKDIENTFAATKPDASGRYRALASLFIEGEPLGKFKYDGTRKDDANDIIPHELRRELRGLRVIASWINHADTGDKNTFDAFIKVGEKTGFVRHYLLDFGSTLGSGNYTNGPFRVGHEYLFDGAAMSQTLFTLGKWRRPWEERGVVRYPEVGYFDTDLFEPAAWKPNYPNLAFVRMDDADALWGAKIVAAFTDELIDRIVASAAYTRSGVAQYIAKTLKGRRDIVTRYWFDRVTAAGEIRIAANQLHFRPLANDRECRVHLESASGRTLTPSRPCSAIDLLADWPEPTNPDRFGRQILGRAVIQTRRRDGNWAAPFQIVLGREAGVPALKVLGWNVVTP